MTKYVVMLAWPTEEFDENGERVWEDIQAAEFSNAKDAIEHLKSHTVEHNPDLWHRFDFDEVPGSYIVRNIETACVGFVLRS